MLPHVRAVTRERFLHEKQAPFRQMLLPVIGLVVGLAAAAGGAVVGVVLLTATLEHRRDHAILRAVGLTRRRLLATALTESGIASALGVAAGAPPETVRRRRARPARAALPHRDARLAGAGDRARRRRTDARRDRSPAAKPGPPRARPRAARLASRVLHQPLLAASLGVTQSEPHSLTALQPEDYWALTLWRTREACSSQGDPDPPRTPTRSARATEMPRAAVEVTPNREGAGRVLGATASPTVSRSPSPGRDAFGQEGLRGAGPMRPRQSLLPILVLGFVALGARRAAACYCDCYFYAVQKDCGNDAGVICNRNSGCKARKPKPEGVKGAGCNEDNTGAAACDGTCEKSKGSCVGESAAQVSKAVRLWSKAYFKAAVRGGGQPDPTLVTAATTVPVIANTACRDEIRTAAINAQVYSYAEGAFVIPGPGTPNGLAPGIGDPCTKAAARYTGLGVALELRRPGLGRLEHLIDRIAIKCAGLPEPPIGPCADAADLGIDPIVCQKAEMQGLVAFLNVPSQCGNGVIDPGEECEQDADCGAGPPDNFCSGCSCAEGCAAP